jgi:hypothetical protein
MGWMLMCVTEFLVGEKDCSSPSTIQPGQVLLTLISTSLEPSEFPSMGKGLGVMKRLLKKCLRVQNSNLSKNSLDALVSRWHTAVEVDEGYVEK